MVDLWKGRNHSAWSVIDQVDVLRPSLECFGTSSASSSCSGSLGIGSSSCSDKSPRSRFRHSNPLLVEGKAYPLPHPLQFENLSGAASPSSDPTNDISRPLSSFMCKERQKPRVKYDSAISPCERPLTAAMEHLPPLPRDCLDQAGVLERSSGSSAERDALGFLHDDVAVKKAEEVEEAGSRLRASRKVVVVYDGEKKFKTTLLDIAIKGYATSEGDTIVVMVFLEHILCPMRMKMVADMKLFSGVNDSILKQIVSSKKLEIESKLRETSRLQLCQMKKIHLEVKVLPGSNSKALVVKETLALQATSVIFDKNAMKNRKYYEENLSCHVLRLRSDGRRVETVPPFGQRLEKEGSLTSYSSDSSSSSLSSEPACNSPSIWSTLCSRLNIFTSKSNTGKVRHSHRGQASIMSSSVTSSESGSPRPVLQEDDKTTVAEEAFEESFSFDTPKPVSNEALGESFSFDTPKLNPNHEAYVYAALGLDDYSLYRRRNRGAFSTASAA